MFPDLGDGELRDAQLDAKGMGAGLAVVPRDKPGTSIKDRDKLFGVER